MHKIDYLNLYLVHIIEVLLYIFIICISDNSYPFETILCLKYYNNCKLFVN